MWILKTGIFLCGLSVIIGSFGAHSLENIIGDKIETFKTAVQYQIFHAIGLILVGLIAKTFRLEFLSGIILFSGSLYLISVYKYSFLGIITPIGGLCFIIGWAILLFKLNNEI
jgi:uncharacterized membrane protein YgdD (TMEM256/DUF423 family)